MAESPEPDSYRTLVRVNLGALALWFAGWLAAVLAWAVVAFDGFMGSPYDVDRHQRFVILGWAIAGLGHVAAIAWIVVRKSRLRNLRRVAVIVGTTSLVTTFSAIVVVLALLWIYPLNAHDGPAINAWPLVAIACLAMQVYAARVEARLLARRSL